MLIVGPLIHFGVVVVLMWFKYTAYYDKTYPLEFLLSGVMMPGEAVAALVSSQEVKIGILIANSVLWGVGLAIVTRMCFGWTLVSRQRESGKCEGCGYDLRGSAGDCPECGASRKVDEEVKVSG